MLGLLGLGLVIQLLLLAFQLPFGLIEQLLQVGALVGLEGWLVLLVPLVLVSVVVVGVLLHLL